MLTDAAIRRSKPTEKQYKLSDSEGLYLLVTPTGSRLWRMKYRWKLGESVKEKTLSFGPYPQVSLLNARKARDEAKADLRAGKDPSLTRKQKRAVAAASQAATLEAVAKSWLKVQAEMWSPKHAKSVEKNLAALVYPRLGVFPVTDITPPMVRQAILDIEAHRAKDIARRIRQQLSAIFVHAIACGLAESDPAGVIRKAFPPVSGGHHPAIINLEDLKCMLRDAEATQARPLTKLALRLLCLTATRPGELRHARWEEFDGDRWHIPAERMKMRRPHTVPLSRQAQEIIEQIRQITGNCPYVFPSTRWAHRPMSENAIGYLLNRAGYAGRHVPHGFRSSFSSIMNERRPEDRTIIDLMLAHAPRNEVEGIYNRAEHMERKSQIGQEWADLISASR